MASQQPRPAWFRLSALAGRAPAPTPARPPVPAAAPARPPAPLPASMRPSIPTRPAVPPTQTQELAAPVRPQSPVAAAARPPRPAATAMPSSSSAPERFTVVPTPLPQSLPPAAPQPSQPRPPPASASSRPSPPAPTAAAAAATASPEKSIPSLSSQSPILAPAPATKSPLQRSPIRKETSTTSTYAPAAPSSPETKTDAAPSSAMLMSPVPKAAETITGMGAAAMPVSSPKVVKPLERTLVQSPKLKPASHPPSPFRLPPAQVNTDEVREPEAKIDQKNVLVHPSIERPMNKQRTHNNAVPSNGKREPIAKDKGQGKKAYVSEEMGMRMITLAGENKGAVMELTPSHKKAYLAGNPRSLQKLQAGTKSGTSNGNQLSGENDEGKYGNKTNRSVTMQSPMKTSLNSNVQGLNNSILFNCTFRNNDPGIHLSLTRKANSGHMGALD